MTCHITSANFPIRLSFQSRIRVSTTAAFDACKSPLNKLYGRPSRCSFSQRCSVWCYLGAMKFHLKLRRSRRVFSFCITAISVILTSVVPLHICQFVSPDSWSVHSLHDFQRLAPESGFEFFPEFSQFCMNLHVFLSSISCYFYTIIRFSSKNLSLRARACTTIYSILFTVLHILEYIQEKESV